MSQPAHRDSTHPVRRALADTWAVGLALIPLGLAFGVLMTQRGFAWWWTPVFSVVIYAGSMEFLAIGLVTGGASVLAAALSAFMVNFRHVFYGLSFPRHRIRGRLARAYSTYAITDESYAIVAAQPPGSVEGRRALAVQVICQLFWVGSTTAGALTGMLLPPSVRGLEFALVALFVVLAMEAFRADPDLSLVLVPAGLAAASWWLWPREALVVALSVLFLLLVVRYAVPGLDRLLALRVGRGPMTDAGLSRRTGPQRGEERAPGAPETPGDDS